MPDNEALTNYSYPAEEIEQCAHKMLEAVGDELAAKVAVATALLLIRLMSPEPLNDDHEVSVVENLIEYTGALLAPQEAGMN